MTSVWVNEQILIGNQNRLGFIPKPRVRRDSFQSNLASRTGIDVLQGSPVFVTRFIILQETPQIVIAASVFFEHHVVTSYCLTAS